MANINGLEINVNDKFNFAVVAGGSAFLRRIETWQVLKIDEARENVFMAKVGKDGSLLKVSPQNMANVSFKWLALGNELKNIARVK